MTKEPWMLESEVKGKAWNILIGNKIAESMEWLAQNDYPHPVALSANVRGLTLECLTKHPEHRELAAMVFKNLDQIEKIDRAINRRDTTPMKKYVKLPEIANESDEDMGTDTAMGAHDSVMVYNEDYRKVTQAFTITTEPPSQHSSLYFHSSTVTSKHSLSRSAHIPKTGSILLDEGIFKSNRDVQKTFAGNRKSENPGKKSSFVVDPSFAITTHRQKLRKHLSTLSYSDLCRYMNSDSYDAIRYDDLFVKFMKADFPLLIDNKPAESTWRSWYEHLKGGEKKKDLDEVKARIIERQLLKGGRRTQEISTVHVGSKSHLKRVVPKMTYHSHVSQKPFIHRDDKRQPANDGRTKVVGVQAGEPVVKIGKPIKTKETALWIKTRKMAQAKFAPYMRK